MWKWLARLLARIRPPAKRVEVTERPQDSDNVPQKPTSGLDRPDESPVNTEVGEEPPSGVEQLTAVKDRNDSDRQSEQPGGFLSLATDVPAKTQPLGKRRSLWLGVDYGTSMSKLVITDYDFRDGTRSFPVRAQRIDGEHGDYRTPSTVALESGAIRFGIEAESHADTAEAVYRSMKMLCAYPSGFYGDTAPLPAGLDARDLATLFVGHLIQLGEQAATRYAKGLGAEPSFGITLGVPMAQLDDEGLHGMFVAIAREAFNLRDKVDLLASVSIDSAIDALSVVRKELVGNDPPKPRDWVRSEAEAALFWAHGSPEIPEGRYACVDVGAGTTSASWFHISGKQLGDDFVKDRLSFYGAACAPPGCDAVDAVLADDLGLSSRAEAREQEGEMLGALSDAGKDALGGVLDELAEVFGKASTEAINKEKSRRRWRGIGRVFFLGGGSKIAVVRDRLIEGREWLMPSPIAEPGVPADLVEEDGAELRDDPTFLLVAYGLSRRLADVPDTFRPSEVVDFQPLHREKTRVRHEDLYGN